MRDELLKGIETLCWMFPQLKPSINYSDVLSQEEVDAFAAFVNGHVQNILKTYPTDEKAQENELSSLFTCSCGLSRIRKEDVVLVEALLLAASGNDRSISPKMRDVVDFLRSHRKIWWSLHNAYTKIVKNDLIGTCPLVVAQQPVLDRVLPFGKKLHNFQEFHKLFHESIHFVLEESGVCFGDEAVDEGLVTYLHEQVMGKKVCLMHYTGDEGEKYLKYASVFEKALSPYPRSAMIPVLLRLKSSTAQ